MQLHLSIYLSEILHLDGKEDIKITWTMCLNDKLIKNILVGMLWKVYEDLFSDITTSNLVHLRYDEEMNRDKKTQCDQSCYQPGLSDCVMWGSNWSYLSRSDTIRPTDCPNVPELEALLHLVSLWSSNQPDFKTEPHILVLVVNKTQSLVAAASEMMLLTSWVSKHADETSATLRCCTFYLFFPNNELFFYKEMNGKIFSSSII